MTAPRPDAPHPDVALLADLDAGVLGETRAREVRAAAEADRGARAVLDALAATRADLATLGDPPVPPELAERWRAALRAEQSPPPPMVEPLPRLPTPAPRTSAATPALRTSSAGPPPTRRTVRRRALLRRPAVLAGVLLVAALVGSGVLKARQEQLPGVERPQLVAQGLSTIGVRDSGGLDDLTRRTACLQAVAAPGVAPAAPLLGGRRVTFEGTPGVLLVLGTGKLGTFDVVIVDPTCGPGGGTLLTATHITPQ